MHRRLVLLVQLRSPVPGREQVARRCSFSSVRCGTGVTTRHNRVGAGALSRQQVLEKQDRRRCRKQLCLEQSGAGPARLRMPMSACSTNIPGKTMRWSIVGAALRAFGLIMGIVAVAAWGLSAHAANCRAKALLGAACEANCDNLPCVAVSGIFRCCAACLGPNGENPCADMRKPDVTPKQWSDAQDFIEWSASQTPGIVQLGVLAQAVLEAYRNGSDADYARAEQNFSQQWNSLSASEQQQVEDWRRSRGYY